MGKKHPAGAGMLASLLLFLLAACLAPLPAAGQESPEAAPAAEQAAEAAPTEDAGDAGEEEEDVEYTDADFDEVERISADAGTLRYGADLEGGVPYIFESWDGSGKLIGYEVEILDYISRELGKKLVMIQNDWDKLIPGLSRDLYDVAIEGQEITPEHEEAVLFTVPYYITGLSICVRNDNFLISGVEDLHGKVVGTLKASGAFYLLESLGDVDIRAYQTEVNGFGDLINGRLDAVMFDGPVALYYGGPMPEVKILKPEIGRIAYGFTVSKDKPELLNDLNTVLMKMRKNGELRRILDRWKMWNSATANEFQDFTASSTAPAMYQAWVEQSRPVTGWRAKFDRYVSFLPIMGKGAWLTLQVSFLAMLLAIMLGFMLATIRVYAPRPLGILATLYIEIVRGTPVLIQLYFIFYGLPALGIKFSPFLAGVVGLGLNYAAYEAENYRAGFISVPHSQMEAALGLAMTRWQAIRHVIAPQAFRVVLPPVTNDFISLIKDSSLVSVITMVELTKTYGLLATTYYDYFGTGIMVAVIYLLLGLPFVRLARWTEKKLAVSQPGMRR